MQGVLHKRTKIVATIGPASQDAVVMRSLLQSGANVFRLNFSHGTPQEHGTTIKNARTISRELGVFAALLQDLPGPKIRTGTLSGGMSSVHLERDQIFTLTTKSEPGSAERVSVSYPGLPMDVAVGKRIYLQDGAITLHITDKSETDIVTTVEFGGDLRATQGINYPDGSLNLRAPTERDLEYLAFGIEQGVDYVAISFVRSAEDVRKVKAFVAERKSAIPVLAKIEKHEALDDIDAIVAEADGIMVARGDLGIEMPLQAVPMIQKDLIARCNRAGKPVITATQMLESMISSSRPTRAEATDVANAILDGTDALMLSGETARGAYPTEAVRTMTEIALEVERSYPHEELHKRALQGLEHTISRSIAEASTRTSEELGMPFIVTGTTTGHTANNIAAFRPRARIVALTPNETVARRLALLWGTESLLIDHYDTFDALLAIAEDRMLSEGYVRSGDLIAFTTGMPVGAGRTNLLKIHQIP